ncbi:hypothetical protein Sarmat_00975 [Rickettsiales endosymbiont of Paramecium tredecaurelia]|nr:hypothetical protein [Candidatus Sarmatiella mevalonica]
MSALQAISTVTPKALSASFRLNNGKQTTMSVGITTSVNLLGNLGPLKSLLILEIFPLDQIILFLHSCYREGLRCGHRYS